MNPRSILALTHEAAHTKPAAEHERTLGVDPTISPSRRYCSPRRCHTRRCRRSARARRPGCSRRASSEGTPCWCWNAWSNGAGNGPPGLDQLVAVPSPIMCSKLAALIDEPSNSSDHTSESMETGS